MTNQTNYLYQKLDTAFEMGFLTKEIPNIIKDNLNPNFECRPYQIEAFSRFIYYFNDYPQKQVPIHLLFNMATGSGKTLIMAGLIIYLYTKGYRNFLFFVNSSNIIEKTKDNFLNNLSTKYLFNQKIIIENQTITMNKVDNFEGVNTNDINICFTTIQKLHTDLIVEKENAITLEDFKDKKIVLLSDEAHHGQVKTKNQQLMISKELEKPNWENTVEQIFNQNKENLLLEFTATMDFLDKNVEQKYLNKIIYKYDLKEFRQDKYSKEVTILQADLSKEERMLTAVILNQYRQDIATKYKINLKPVILFKAQKTIAESQENKDLFHNLIENLSQQSITDLKANLSIDELQKALWFYSNEKISDIMLINKLKQNFAPNKTLSVNEEKEKETNQLLINSLEDKDNQIRAIFAVQKLNEGWDVLNLFDIVRLYDARDGKAGKPGKTTIAEAQLIGRGARYCPFKLDISDDKYTRKYDEDLTHELRILEELHYHCLNEPRYISEIKTALIKEGIIDDKLIEKELTLKDSFKETDFYQNGLIYLNKKIKNNYKDIKSFNDLGIKEKDFNYKLHTHQGKTIHIFQENDDTISIKTATKTISLKDIDKHIIKNALAKNDFFKFSNIKIYFPCLKSITDIIEKEEYLASINIVFEGIQEDIENISNKNKFQAIASILSEIENRIKNNLIEYKGSQEFEPSNINKVFSNKTLKLKKDSERASGQEDQIKNWDWFVFNANYGTDEEKACVKLMAIIVEEKLSKQYDEIFLIRNELHFKIFNFKDGEAFSPDFVLFLKDKNGQKLTYQIFIEPKASYLAEVDKWKESFLLEITERYKDEIITFNENRKYKLIGLPFYNQNKENSFKNELIGRLS